MFLYGFFFTFSNETVCLIKKIYIWFNKGKWLLVYNVSNSGLNPLEKKKTLKRLIVFANPSNRTVRQWRNLTKHPLFPQPPYHSVTHYYFAVTGGRVGQRVHNPAMVYGFRSTIRCTIQFKFIVHTCGERGEGCVRNR